MASSVTLKKRRFGQSAHLIRGFSQTPRTHSLAQAGAYPDLPVFRFSNRRGYTSSRPRKSDRNKAILTAGGEFFVTASPARGEMTFRASISDAFLPGLYFPEAVSRLAHRAFIAPLRFWILAAALNFRTDWLAADASVPWFFPIAPCRCLAIFARADELILRLAFFGGFVFGFLNRVQPLNRSLD